MCTITLYDGLTVDLTITPAGTIPGGTIHDTRGHELGNFTRTDPNTLTVCPYNTSHSTTYLTDAARESLTRYQTGNHLT